VNEDEALFEARREIAQLQRKIKKLKNQNEALYAHNKTLLNEQITNGSYIQMHRDAWNRYWDVMRKCERQRLAILDIQASPRGAKHWSPEYIIDEQESLQEALSVI
jgi:hypothetical protein